MEYMFVPQTFIKHRLCAGHCARASRPKDGYNGTALALRGQWGRWISHGKCILSTMLCIYLITGVLGTGKGTQQ